MLARRLIKSIIVIFIFLAGLSGVLAISTITFEPSNQYNAGDVLTFILTPDRQGMYKYIYLYNEKNELQDTIILNNCQDYTCYNTVRIKYSLPTNWAGNYYVAVYDYSINDYLIGNFSVTNKITFDRTLNCNRCSNHKAPPLTDVEMTINVNGFNGNGNLVDYFEKDWTVIDANNGVVSDYDTEFNKITWNVNVNNSISKTYIIKSPDRTMPATKYTFYTELTSRSNDWFVIISDPTNVVEELLPIVDANTKLVNTQLTQTQVNLIKYNDNLYLNVNKNQKLGSELSDTTLTPSVINNAYCNLYYYTDPTVSGTSTFLVYKKKGGTLIDSANIPKSVTETSIMLTNLQMKGLTISDIPTLFLTVYNIYKGNPSYLYVDKISCIIDYSISANLALGVSDELNKGVQWSIQTLPVTDKNAIGNNESGNTLYYLDINSQGTNADVYLKGNSNLISGTNSIALQNEKVSSSITDSTIAGGVKKSITLNYTDNRLGNNLANGTRIYLKFYLSVSGSQAAGNYLNTLNFKAVPAGVAP